MNLHCIYAKNELILYETSTNQHIEVRLEDETVWLTQNQMADLFEATKQNISLHIHNIFKEQELTDSSTVKESLIVQKEGKRLVQRKILYYNLDVIISVEYRVKSQRGTQFRIWANEILKHYLLKGYAIHQRIDRLESKIEQHDKQFDLLIKTALPPQEGIFFDGQIFDAYEFVAELIKSATKELILIDNYIDETTLSLLSKKRKTVKAAIYTQKISEMLQADVKKYKEQYGDLELRVFKKAHDRFLIIDTKEVYHIGASIKDVGKKPVESEVEPWFAFSKMKIKADLILKELKSNTQSV